MRVRARTPLIASLLFGLLVVQPVAALAQPANDDRADATVVTAVPFLDVVDVTGATDEPDEPQPDCAPSSGTVWYAITLDRRTPIVVDTAGSGYDTVAAVWTTDLDQVACNDDAGSLQSRVGFTAAAGTTYLVQIGAFDGYIDPEFDTPELVVSIERGRTRTVRPQPERYSFRGQQATADDWEETEDGYSGRFVQLVDGRSGRYAISEVYVSSYDVTFMEKDGVLTETFTDWWGYAELASGAFERKLEGASVDQDVELYGYSCSGPVIDWDDFDEETDEWPEYDCIELGVDTARVAVTWTGVGPTFRFSERGRFTDPWGTYTYRYQGTSRDALVSGGVTGDIVSFDLDGADGRLLQLSSSDTFRPARR
jgi:hypothetical protein